MVRRLERLRPSFRSVRVLAAISGAALLLGGCTGDGGTATATPTPEVTSEAATRTATAVAGLPPGLEIASADAWTRQELSPADDVPDRPGVFIVDAVSGEGTLWSWPEESGPVAAPPGVSAGFIVPAVSNTLVDTVTGQTWRWRTSTELIAVNDEGLGLFSRPDIGGCGFSVVEFSDSEPRSLGTFTLDRDRCRRTGARFSPDGVAVLVTIESGSSATDLYVVDIETQRVELMGTMASRSAQFASRTDPDLVLMTAPGDGELWVGRYVWSDRELTVSHVAMSSDDVDPGRDMPITGSALVSPDGQWVAWREGVDLGVGDGLGGLAEWPVTVIASVSEGIPVIRAERVAMTSGIKQFDWLADSSALVVQAERGFALLATDGRLSDLPFPVAPHTGAVPTPAPDRTDQFLYDGAIVDAAGESIGGPSAVHDVWGRHESLDGPHWWIVDSYRWGSSSRQLVLTRIEPYGGDYGRGGIALLGLPPRIVTGADATRARIGALRVAADGDRLNVRSQPGAAGERIGQFTDGSVVIVGRDPLPSDCFGGCSVLRDPDLDYGEGWWIYVSGEDGDGEALEGWVSTEFVEWAD
jgi:hypothetical protein